MYKVKNNGYNPLSLIFLVLIVLLVFNAGYFIRMIQPNLSFGKAKMEEITRIKKDNFDKDESIFLIDHGIIQISNDEMIYIDDALKKKWSKKVNGTDIKVFNNGDYIYVIDATLGDVFKVDYEGNIQAKVFSQGNIEKVIDYNDRLLTVLTEKNYLISFDENLEKVNEENLNLDHILDIKKNDHQYYILNIEHKNKTYFTRVVSLDESFAFLSNLNINDTITYNIHFNGDKRLLQSNKKMLLVDASDETLWTVTTDHIIKEVIFKDYIYVYTSDAKIDQEVGLSEDQAIDRLFLYDDKGVKIDEMSSPIKQVNKMVKYNDKLFLVNDQELCVIDSNLEVLFIREMVENINDIRVLPNERVILDTEENLVIYEFKY